MHHTGKGSALHFLFQNGGHILIRVTRMHDNGQFHFTRHGDLRPKAGGLLIWSPIIIEIIEAGFANRHAFWVVSRGFDGIDITSINLVPGLMRVNADRTPHIVISLGDCLRRV